MLNFANMYSEGKRSKTYLEQISKHPEEKTLLMTEALKKGDLPKGQDGKITILELGIGGGESMKTIRDKAAEDVNIVGVDVLPELVHAARKKYEIPSVVADISRLPFRDNSISGINASAIFHEAGSYGVRDGVETYFGLKAVEILMKEMRRVLLPNGLLTYRDVLGPRENLLDEKRVTYHEGSWQKFIHWFSPDFLSSGPKFYNPHSLHEDFHGKDFFLSAPVGLHREIQRHYLLLRDYIHLHMPEKNADQVINDALSTDNAGTSSVRVLLETWRKREGKEWYIYGTPTDVLLAGLHAYDTQSREVLFPADSSQVRTIPRSEFNHYLQEVIDFPEFDGKLMIGFKKIDKKKIVDWDPANSIIDWKRINSALNE